MNASNPPRVRFVRKPGDLSDVLYTARQDGGYDEVAVVIEKEWAMDLEEYDAFVADFFQNNDWLAGFGGCNALRQWCAIRITAPERRTIYVNPEGCCYARYVGVAVED